MSVCVCVYLCQSVFLSYLFFSLCIFLGHPSASIRNSNSTTIKNSSIHPSIHIYYPSNLYPITTCSLSITMAEKTILFTLPKFNSTNWFEWKKQVETFLMLGSLDEVIDAGVNPVGKKDAGWIEKDRKAYAYIFFPVEPNYRAPILDIKSGRVAWNKLFSEHEKTMRRRALGFDNNSIRYLITPLSASQFSLTQSPLLLDSSCPLVTSWMTSKSVTSCSSDFTSRGHQFVLRSPFVKNPRNPKSRRSLLCSNNSKQTNHY